MRFTFIAALALIGTALANPVAQDSGKKIPIGQPCKKDGSMGICEGGFCLQAENQPQGTCQQQ
ncbi:hypothetical protein MPDQ_004314 [Monascus purpureus]|uniref:CBM1 domain-containing protein n=1 Tax=Monascus purpureus TaxID=5098 RepID=A0A507QL85_MONPU|nr:hypothetical protein MPDQ_004314 [Monascus purpureus]BDD62547.1 hypothetical protein MAP00_007516 [Monascus purpureus]